MKTTISALLLLMFLLTGCTAKTYYYPNYSATYVYADDDALGRSKRVDYVGYGLGGHGFGGYSMGGYGLTGYAGGSPL